MAKFNQSYVGSSDALEGIIHETENLFAKYYEKGNRKQAVQKLRTKAHTEDHLWTMWRVGMNFGIAIPLMLQGMVLSQNPRTRIEVS